METRAVFTHAGTDLKDPVDWAQSAGETHRQVTGLRVWMGLLFSLLGSQSPRLLSLCFTACKLGTGNSSVFSV